MRLSHLPISHLKGCLKSLQQNKALVSRFMVEVWHQGILAVSEEIVAPNFLDHAGPPNLPPGPEGVKMQVMAYRAGIPDLTFTVDILVAEGDLVVCRWTGRGHQTGTLFGIPPTGLYGEMTGTHIFRIVNDRLVERWGNSDDLGLLRQLGVIPDMG
jgi:predicted ester cyclase